MRFEKEDELLDPVSRYLERQSYCVQPEVPFFDRRMDLAGYSGPEDPTVAVELKLNNWGRAVEQACVYQLCSDLVYIAMPEYSSSNVDLHELRVHGIGLLSVAHSGECEEVMPATRSQVVRERYRDATRAFLMRKE